MSFIEFKEQVLRLKCLFKTLDIVFFRIFLAKKIKKNYSSLWHFFNEYLDNFTFPQSALMQAIIRGNADEVRSLIYRRCDVNEQDVEKRTPLHLAAFMGNVEITILLILNGARVNCKDSQWLTPIHRACHSSHEACN